MNFQNAYVWFTSKIVKELTAILWNFTRGELKRAQHPQNLRTNHTLNLASPIYHPRSIRSKLMQKLYYSALDYNSIFGQNIVKPTN